MSFIQPENQKEKKREWGCQNIIQKNLQQTPQRERKAGRRNQEKRNDPTRPIGSIILHKCKISQRIKPGGSICTNLSVRYTDPK